MELSRLVRAAGAGSVSTPGGWCLTGDTGPGEHGTAPLVTPAPPSFLSPYWRMQTAGHGGSNGASGPCDGKWVAIIGVLWKIVSHSSLDFRIKLPGKRGTEECFVEDCGACTAQFCTLPITLAGAKLIFRRHG